MSHCSMLHNHNYVPECGRIIETLEYRDVGLKKCWIIEMLD